MNLSEPETIRKAIDSVRHQSSPWSVADKQLRNRAASTTDDLDQPTGTHTTMVPTLQTHHHHMRSVSGPCAIENTNNSSDRPLPLEESMGHPSNAVVSRGNSIASSAMTDSAVSMPFASARDAYGVVQHSMFPVLPLASMILQTTQRRHADDSLQKEWHRQSDDASSRPFTTASTSSPRMHSNTFRATPSVAPSPPTSGGDEITKNTLGKLLSGNRSSAQRQRHRTASANTTGAIADVRRGNHHIGSGYHQQQRLSAPPTLDVIVGDPEVERLSSAGHSSRPSSTAAGGEGGGVPSPPLSGLGAASVSALTGKDVLLCENMIKILVDEYIAKFGNAVSLESTRQQQAHARGSGAGTAEPPPLLHHSGSSDPSMFLASVFSVSPLFESALLARGGCGSSKQLEQRRLSHQAKIAPLHQTRIPEAYWILRDPMHTASIPPTSTSLTAKNAFVHLHEGKKTLTFPSTNPSNRPEVYLLAHTLDRLVCDTVHQREALFDAAAAFEIIPEQPSKANEATATEQLQRYTTVVREMYDVIDVGLSELARQTAPTCVERASLLDCIRRLTMDLQGTLLDVVSHCKLRAFSEAKQRQEHDDIIVTKNRQILDARARIAALEEHVLELEREKETNEIKAQRFDVIVSRMELKEQQRQRAIVRADQTEIMSEVDEAVSMSVVEAAHRFDEMLSLASSTGGGAPIESTVAKLERLKREEEQRGNTQMYEECVRLMKTLRQAVEATDAACEPFYQKMLFGSPELNARVSAGRWAAIGKAIGDYEAVYDHRERVAKAHALWLEVVAGHSASASAGTGNSFHQQRVREERSSSLEVPEEATTSTTTPRAAGVPAALLQTVDCTIEHLRAMGVNDVTTEEISMFQNPTFDMDKYLHPTQQLPSRWGLDSVGVGQMLVDVQTTFQEIVLRLNALKKSGLLAEISKPPLMPPARPSDQCSLCGRRDAAEVEKRHQRSLLDNVAKEIAHREEEAMIAVKAMQSERDSWKSQCAELTETIQKLEFRLDMMEHRPLSNTTRSPHPSDTDSPRANANAAFMSHKPSDSDIRGEQQIVVRTSGGGGGGAGSSMGVGASSASRRGSDVRRSPEDSQKQKAGVVRRSSVSKSPIVLDGGSHPSSPNSMQRQRSFSVDGHSSDGSVDKNRKAKGAASSSKSIKEDSTASTSNALSKKASSLHRKGGGGGSSDGLASSSSGVLVRGGGKKSTLHSSKSSANMATTAAAGGGGGVPEEITKGVSPLVIQLVINCSCCNGGKTKKKASDVDGGLELSTEQLAAAVSVTPEGEEAGGGKALPSFSPPRRPNTGGSHRPREVQLASSQSGTLPSMMNSTTLTRRPRTEVGEGEEEEEDKETRGKPIVIPEDEGFAFMAPKLKSFLGSPDPVLAANGSGGGGTAAAPTATTTTRNIRLPSIIASDDESSSSGDDTDHHGHPQSQPPSQPLDPAEGGEGGGMPSIGSSTIVFEHRRRKSSMWESVEDSIMHKLKSIRITKLMSATQPPVDPTTSGTMTTAAQRPTGPRPPANRRASTERKGSATALQHGADAAAAATAAEEETMKRVASAVSVIVSLSEPDRIKQELNKALEVVRQNILRVAGRVENLMSRTCIRPLGWLLRIIDGYYRAKRLSDATAEQDHHPYTPCVRFLFTYLKRQLGAMELVLEHMHYLYLSCDAYMATDMRVMQFLRVLFVYDLRTTTFFLQFSCFTEQCSIGLDFSSSHQHFARDDAIHKQEVLCLRRIAACLTETGLHRRSYAPLLWKTLTHSAVCFPVNDTEWFSSMEKAGMIAESTQRINPKAWSDVDVNLMRFVVHKSAFLSLVCHFEMEDQTRRKNNESK